MGFAFQSVGKYVDPEYQVFFQGRSNDGPLAVNIFGGGCVSDTEIRVLIRLRGEPTSGQFFCENLVFQFFWKFLVFIFGLDLFEDAENRLVWLFEKIF